jgi:archaellum biogenesis ATPase FlaH
MNDNPDLQSLPAAWRTLVENGFSVIPIEPRGKRPLGLWKEYQTRRAPLDTIRQWAARPSNIGIATGEVSGLVVLDLDSDEAVQEAVRRGLPQTITVKTGKGLHVYFRHPGGIVANRAGLLPGWDIRGDGGCVVAAGSVHPSGAIYRWENAPGAAPLANMPDWLVELLAKPEAKPTEHQLRGASAYGEKAIDNELAAMRRAIEGQRNDQLNKSAFSLAQLAAGGVIDADSTRNCLRAIAVAVGLPWEEIQATLDSGWKAGFAKPRTPEDLHLSGGAGGGENAFDPVTGELLPDEDSPIEALDLLALAAKTPTSKQFVIPMLAPAGEVTLGTGPGSAGKSLLGQQVATAIAAGVPTLGIDMGQAAAIYITCEDDIEQLHWRQAAICRALGVSMADLDGKLWLVSLRGRLDNALGVNGASGDYRLSRAYQRLADLIRRTGAKLVILDNLSHLFTGNENDRGDVTRFANALNRLAGESGAAIVLIGHTNKAFLQGNKQGNSHSCQSASKRDPASAPNRDPLDR